MQDIIISGLVAVLVASVPSYLAYRSNVRAKSLDATAAPYADMAAELAATRERLDRVEAKVQTLLQDQWVDRTYMRQMLHAWPADQTLPQPMPGWIAEHYGLTPMHPPTPGVPKED